MTLVTHLVDDTTAGGVMRVLDFIRNDPAMARIGTHRVVHLSRKGRTASRFEGDIIVSHLSISWRRLPWLLTLRARHASRVLIHVEHSYTEAFAALNVPRPARFRTLLSTAFALFDRVVAVSAEQGRWLTERGFVSPGRLSVIRSAVDVAPFLAMEPAPARPLRIGAIGRLDTQKGFDTLIKAFLATETPGLELHLFGDGEERTALEELAAGEPRIVFHGHSDDPVAAMASVDAVAMPSRWEAYGLVALEARAAGRPLLVSPVDGLKDHAEAGAIAIATSGVPGWAAALDRLARGIDEDRVLAARRDAAGAARAFAAGWAALCDEVLRPEQEDALAV